MHVADIILKYHVFGEDLSKGTAGERWGKIPAIFNDIGMEIIFDIDYNATPIEGYVLRDLDGNVRDMCCLCK